MTSTSLRRSGQWALKNTFGTMSSCDKSWSTAFFALDSCCSGLSTALRTKNLLEMNVCPGIKLLSLVDGELDRGIVERVFLVATAFFCDNNHLKWLTPFLSAIRLNEQ